MEPAAGDEPRAERRRGELDEEAEGYGAPHRAPSPRMTGLGPLGLSPTEERVYRQVITAGGGSARITARILRLPPVEVDQALERLNSLGLIARSNADVVAYVPGHGVEASGSRAVQYVPEPPVSTLGAMLATHAAGLISAGTTVEQLADLYNRGRPELADQSHARVVTGRGVNQAVYEMLAQTRVELLNLDRQPFVAPSDPHPLLAAMRDVLERGVSVRTIYAGDAFRMAGYNEYMTEAAMLGEQARLLNHLPMRFLVSDAATGVLPLTSDGPWITSALIVHGHELVEDLVHTFEDLWIRATSLTSPEALDDSFTEAERALIQMLSTDMTETAIGRHLGASARTIGRRLAQVQHKLGAQTRFGMGVEAARRGLV